MADQVIKVLLIEDNPGDVRLLQEYLRDVTTTRFNMQQVEDLALALKCLAEDSFDVILLDLSLPDSQGLETFVKIHSQTPTIPIVVLTGLDDEALVLNAMQAGAQDYLVKGQVNGDLLTRAMRYAIERQRSEQRIREQAALLDIATDAIFVQNLENEILFWNKGAERLYGWNVEEARGNNTFQLLYEEPALEIESPQAILAAQGEWQGELTQLTKSGKRILVESRWTLVRDAKHKPKSILVVNTDITQKKQLEAQFLRAQRMESLGTLASGIAHDLNNVLAPILMSVELLQLKFPDAHTQRLLKIVAAAGKRGTELVGQVLSFARGGLEGDDTGFALRKTVQLRHLLKEIQYIIAETFPKSIELYTDIKLDLWKICGDTTQLHQVLMNLVVNARDAMPNGGRLKISAENKVIDQEYTSFNQSAKPGCYVVITVRDTGTGIPPEIIERIFEPFFTTKEVGKGTGLGLSTVIGIVKSHGGFVNVESELGGTSFQVYLPAAEGSDQQVEELELPKGNGELILVVDDESAIRETTKTILETYNYQVLTAGDGVEALTLYAQYHQEISVVLVDMMMPSMDGSITIYSLQKINPESKIIAISGLASNEQIALSAGNSVTFLSKPCTAKDLLQTISSIRN